jgi:hypothetical protein
VRNRCITLSYQGKVIDPRLIKPAMASGKQAVPDDHASGQQATVM